MSVLADASGASLGPFVSENVEPGSRVITDGWSGYQGLASLGYAHEVRNQSAAARRGEDPGELLPAVHRVASLAKRWLLGTHQGSVDEAHLPGYLNEFAFRFNRRRSASRGLVFYRLLELAAGHDPVRYRDLIVRQRSKAPPAPPGTRGHPPSLERPGANRPWRAAEMQLRLLAATTPGTEAHECAQGRWQRAFTDIDAHRILQASDAGKGLLHPAAVKVIATLSNEWDGLARHQDLPQLPLDNNTAERALRTPVIGRKNFYGSGAEWAAHLAADVWTVTATAARHD